MSGATTWAQLIAQQHPAPIVLVEVKVGQRFTGWTATGGAHTNTWQVTVAQESAKHSFRTMSKVTEDGTTDYTSRASIALVDANAGSFYHDTSAGILYVRPTNDGNTDPNDNIIVGEFTLYYSGGAPEYDRTGKPIVFNGNLYYPFIDMSGLPRISLSASDALFGTAQISGGDISLINLGGQFDALAARYLWTGREVVIKLGGDDLPYGEYKTVYTARTRGIRWNETRFTLVVTDGVEDVLNSSVTSKITSADLTRTYNFTHQVVINVAAGPTWTPNYQVISPQLGIAYDGPLTTPFIRMAPFSMAPTALDANAASGNALGQTKPKIYGAAKAQAPVLLAQNTDGSQMMLLLSDTKIHSITNVRDRNGKPYGKNQVVNTQTCYVDPEYGVVLMEFWLTAASFEPKFDAADKPFTFDVECGENSDDFTLKDNPADVIKDIVVTQAGVSATFDSDAFGVAQAQTALFKIAYRLDQPATAREALEPILRTTQAHLLLDRDGEYRIVVWTPRVLSVDGSSVDLVEGSGDIIDIEMSNDDFQFLRQVLVGYTPSGSNQSIYGTSGTLREARALVPVNSTLLVQSPFGDTASATLAAKRIARARANPTKRIVVVTRMKALTAVVMDVVTITRSRLPIDALSKFYGRIYRVETDLVRFTQTITLIDMSSMLEAPSQAFLKADNVELDWDDATAVERLTIGFYTDDNGYVKTADKSTYRASLTY